MKTESTILVKIIGTIAYVLLCTVFLTSCETDYEQVARVKDEIPAATDFIERNVEFLHVLLEIQQRIIDFNGEVLAGAYPDGVTLIDDMGVTIRQDKLEMYLTRGFDNTAWLRFTRGRSINDVLVTADEKDRLENALREIPLENWPHVWISAERVTIAFFEYKRTQMYIEHPSSNFEMIHYSDYSWYDYKKAINDDWCVAVYKNQNN